MSVCLKTREGNSRSPQGVAIKCYAYGLPENSFKCRQQMIYCFRRMRCKNSDS